MSPDFVMADGVNATDSNQKTYQSSGIVRHYAQLNQLQPAEATIQKLLRAKLATMRMLDIGVGAGRTTKHFADLVATYVGVDYSAEMVAACAQRFPRLAQTISLEVADARDLGQFSDNSYDFILFSYNGIDSVSHDDRLKIFQEVNRVGCAGGYFGFSSHNLTAFEREFDWRQQLSWNPGKTYVNLVMAGILHLFNFPIGLKQIQTLPHAILKDESHSFRLKHYYIRPEAQIEQLEMHFDEIKVYSWKSGIELTSTTEMADCTDLWLYYLCRIPEANAA
jgi:ubiquinone/menaquinone biosynthesis C-methylase UbiE